MDITQETRTYSLKQVVQLTNGLLLLPLYATSPDSRTIDGPFAPDGSAILYSLLDGCVWAWDGASVLTERYRFLDFSPPCRGRLAFDIILRLGYADDGAIISLPAIAGIEFN